jgi:dienelactone hydrolase
VTARRRAALVLGLSVLVAACGGDDGTAPSTTPPPSTTAPERPPEVRTEERTFATLPTLVMRPTGDGPFPLVVFVHGAGAPPLLYEGLLRDLAAAGNVVVAPTMPGSADHSDLTALASLPFQPGRVEQVVDAVTDGPQAIAAADPGRIVLVGHSLGAMTALAGAFNTCCTDRRVDAVVSMAGRLATFPGTWGEGTVPVLLVHGEADETVPFSGSGDALQRVGTSAYLLTVVGGDHGGYLDPDDGAYPAVVASIEAFFEATVGGDAQGGLTDLTTAGSMDGVRLTTRGG